MPTPDRRPRLAASRPMTTRPTVDTEALVDALNELVTVLRQYAEAWARTITQLAPDASPGPATGLRMERRDTPDRQPPPGRRRVGFAQPTLDTDQETQQ